MSAQWHPKKSVLAFVSGKGSKIYFWNEKNVSCSTFELPESLPVFSIRWNADGDKLIVIGEKEFCITFLDNENLF